MVLSGDIILFEGDMAMLPGTLQSSPFPDKLLQSRRLALCQSQYVIPGHGAEFAVSDAESSSIHTQPMSGDARTA